MKRKKLRDGWIDRIGMWNAVFMLAILGIGLIYVGDDVSTVKVVVGFVFFICLAPTIGWLYSRILKLQDEVEKLHGRTNEYRDPPQGEGRRQDEAGIRR